MEYYFETSSHAPFKAFMDFERQREEWQEKVRKLGEEFGGKASAMTSGSRTYVGGLRLSTPGSTLPTCYWREPDSYGYSTLRSKPKIPKGTSKEDAARYRASHTELVVKWGDHCPVPLDSHQMWKDVGLVNGSLELGGLQAFSYLGALYIKASRDLRGEVPGAEEILGSAYARALAKYKESGNA